MENIKGYIKQLELFIERLSIDYSYNRQAAFAYNLTIRASLIKCYDFLKLSYANENTSYFAITSHLRSIIEDIIVLKSISSFNQETREILLRRFQEIEVNNRIITQWDFFQKYRPFQSVINRVNEVEASKQEIENIWRQNGWQNFKVSAKNIMPPIRQLAEKLAPGILDILYDFIYRLSSSTVHFSVQTLFRMCWGEIQGDQFNGSISTQNMTKYYETFCKIYGALLFTFYFEFFSVELIAKQNEQLIVQNIRKELLEVIRWPELITFEEMNLEVPKSYSENILPNITIHKYLIEVLKNGFINNNEFTTLIDNIKN